ERRGVGGDLLAVDGQRRLEVDGPEFNQRGLRGAGIRDRYLRRVGSARGVDALLEPPAARNLNRPLASARRREVPRARDRYRGRIGGRWGGTPTSRSRLPRG